MENQKLTPEQTKAIKKLVFKARATLFFIGMKFTLGLFTLNLICIMLGLHVFKFEDPDMMGGFNFMSMLANIILMSLYLNGQFKKNNDSLTNGISEVLKNSKTDEGNNNVP